MGGGLVTFTNSEVIKSLVFFFRQAPTTIKSKFPYYPFFFHNRRLNYRSFLPFLVARTSQLPSFFHFRSFSTRYLIRGFRFRRFGLILPNLFSTLPLLSEHGVKSRLGKRTRYTTYPFRRSGRIFFFKRRVDRLKTSTCRRSLLGPRGANATKALYRRPLRTSRTWLTSFFTQTQLRVNYNIITLPFLPTVYLTSNSFISAWLVEFRVKTTRFLRLDFKQTAIRYNLKPVLTRSAWTLGNRFVYLRNTLIWKPTPFHTVSLNPRIGLTGIPTPQTPVDSLSARKRQLFQLRMRRMPTLWVSKITQRTLTPARREFNLLCGNKPLRYQYRRSVLISRYYRFRVLEFINLLEFSLINVVMRSRFIVIRTVATDFINRGWFVVNGLTQKAQDYLVAPLDNLQLVSSILWIVFYKWHLLAVKETHRRFFYYLRKWRIRARRPYPKQSSFRIPEWVRKRLIFRETAPLFFEVDFFTFSCINLFNPLLSFSNYHYLSINTYAPATVRALNWKSFT